MMRQRNLRREGGYSALWVLIIVALLALSGMALASMEPGAEISMFWVAACAIVAGIGLAVEFRYDSFEFFKNGGVIALVGSAGCGLVVWLGKESHPVALACSAILGIASIGALVAAYRTTRAEEVLPNPLLEIFKKSALSELNGVQFAVTPADARASAGGNCLITVYAQNGMNKERKLEICLKPRADIGKGGHLAFDKVATLTLSAGAAGTLAIPIAVHPKANGTYTIGIVPRVSGERGERLRVFRARPFRQQVKGSLQILALFAGVFIWGGGLNLKLHVTKNKNWKNMPVEKPASSQAEIFYKPGPEILHRMPH